MSAVSHHALRSLSWAALSLLLLSGVEARAQEPVKGDEPPSEPLVWKPQWRRVGVVEYGATAGLLASTLAFRQFVSDEDEPHWTRPILFDDGARGELRARTKDGRDKAAAVSDVLFLGSMAYPFVFDAGVAAWLGHGNPDVAWQLTVIDAETFSVSFFLNAVTKRVASRERPYGVGCNDDPAYAGSCNAATRYHSFYSGHAAMTATAAGLTCAHHAHLPLYGGGVPDAVACGVGIAFTSTTGLLRIASDNHWASDVIVGHAVGFSTGLLMPWFLYYSGDDASAKTSEVPATRLVVLPAAQGEWVGMAASGWF